MRSDSSISVKTGKCAYFAGAAYLPVERCLFAGLREDRLVLFDWASPPRGRFDPLRGKVSKVVGSAVTVVPVNLVLRRAVVPLAVYLYCCKLLVKANVAGGASAVWTSDVVS